MTGTLSRVRAAVGKALLALLALLPLQAAPQTDTQTADNAAAASAAVTNAGDVPAGTITHAHVIARAAQAYGERLAELRAAHALDADARFLAHLQRIAAPLFAQAIRDYPETAQWQWEVHVSGAPDEYADGMAGGKILVGQAYVERMDLNDAELAMLLAHEIAHATLRHNLREFLEALRLEPARAARPFNELWDAVDYDAALMDKLAPLNRAQETEADHAGMRLAWHAGWQPVRMARYYRKLVRTSGWPALESATHPSPLSRWQAMQALATELAAKLAP